MMTDVCELLVGRPIEPPPLHVEPADAAGIADYHRLRRAVFVDEQGLFAGTDADEVDGDPRTVVLVARDRGGALFGGVRLTPRTEPDLGWWAGSRLAVHPAARRTPARVGAALVRAACATAEAAGALRFEATVPPGAERFLHRLGWTRVTDCVVAGAPHLLMRWPIGRIAALAATTKAPLGGPAGFLGGGAPVPGSDLVVACDQVVPAMVERDPEWAGWCAVLMNVNDLAAMGAEPIGLLDAVAARDASFAARILTGLRRAAQLWGVPVLGGHTQLGAPAALSVTALGRTAHPVPAGGGRPGHQVRLTADLGGHWRPGYTGAQWDSTSHRRPAELRAMLRSVAAARPAAAKDVSMAGVAATLGLLAEASGCAAELDVAAVPRPVGTSTGDWLTCFPGFGMLTADRPGAPVPAAGPATSAVCGRLTAGTGVTLRWPDGVCTSALSGPVPGLGAT